MIDILELYNQYPIGCSRILAHFDIDNNVFVSYYDKQDALNIIHGNNLSEKVIDILDFFDSIGCQFSVSGNIQDKFSFQCSYQYKFFAGRDYKTRSEAYKRVINNLTDAIEHKLVKDSLWLSNFISKN